MRKLSLLLFVALLAFTACENDGDDDPAVLPQVTLDKEDMTVAVGEELIIEYTVRPGSEKVKTFIIFRKGEEDKATEIEVKDGEKAFTGNFPVNTSEVGETTYTFRATDKEDNRGEATIKVTVAKPTSYTTTVTDVHILAAPSSDKNSKSFYSVSEDKLYSYSEASAAEATSAKIDFGYYYRPNPEGESVLSSPSSYSTEVYKDLATDWATENKTMFVKSDLNFDNATATEIMAAIDDATTTAELIKELKKGTVLALKTAGGKYALLEVTEIVGTYKNGDSLKAKLKIVKAESPVS